LNAGTNINGAAHDFQKWRLWLELRGKDLLAEGYKIKYAFSDMYNSPKTNLGASSDNTIGDFTSWAEGYCDFEVLDTKSGERLVNEMGLILDDSIFEATFEDFRRHLRL
jgi:hypothetical protein